MEVSADHVGRDFVTRGDRKAWPVETLHVCLLIGAVLEVYRRPSARLL